MDSDKLLKGFGVVALSISGVFFFIIFATFAGAMAGWIVGLVFSETILGILGQIGVRNITMFQFGAFLGFIGGFLKTKTTVEAKK